ncbi:hypothetical protein HK103_005815 [Boothiomyces macroporosus]|uniref:Uncharacterized protein n=1 Tax=Boothiomyces macroporosus TaxID=261099 RepID=A0AAD5Y330_9FUNG|nr:hypothetical protein HK103_005815 [Boothiomyces macroporosus]
MDDVNFTQMIDYENENVPLGYFSLSLTILSILGSIVSIIFVIIFAPNNPKWGYGISVTVGNIDILALAMLQLEILEIFSVLTENITVRGINIARAVSVVLHVICLWAADLNAFVDWNIPWLNQYDIWGEFVFVCIAVSYENIQALCISYLVYNHVVESDKIERQKSDSFVATMNSSAQLKRKFMPKSFLVDFVDNNSALSKYRRLYYSISIVYFMDCFGAICYFWGMAVRDLSGQNSINAIYFMEIGLAFTGFHCTRVGILFHSIRALKLDSLKFKEEAAKTKVKMLLDKTDYKDGSADLITDKKAIQMKALKKDMLETVKIERI